MQNAVNIAEEVGVGRIHFGKAGEPTGRQSMRLKCASKVAYAIKTGKLQKLDGSILCAYCNQRPAVLYDHRSYFAPLDVKPACKSCNFHLGPAEPVWVPDYSANAFKPAPADERQATLEALVSEGRTLEEIGAALHFTRERARQVVWQRGLRAKWIAARKRVKAAGRQAALTAKVGRWLSGGFGAGGYRQRVFDEAVRRGLRVEISAAGKGTGSRRTLRIEGCPVVVRWRAAEPFYPGGPENYATTHPGYIRFYVTLGCVNAIWLSDGRLTFVVASTEHNAERYVYVRGDQIKLDWPTVDEWRDIAAYLASAPCDAPASTKESA